MDDIFRFLFLIKKDLYIYCSFCRKIFVYKWNQFKRLYIIIISTELFVNFTNLFSLFEEIVGSTNFFSGCPSNFSLNKKSIYGGNQTSKFFIAPRKRFSRSNKIILLAQDYSLVSRFWLTELKIQSNILVAFNKFQVFNRFNEKIWFLLIFY